MPQQTLYYAATSGISPCLLENWVGLFNLRGSLGMLVAPMWGVLALVSYPWIVIADSDFHVARALEWLGSPHSAWPLSQQLASSCGGDIFEHASPLVRCWGVSAAHAGRCYLYAVFDLTRANAGVFDWQGISVGLILVGANLGWPKDVEIQISVM